MGYRTGDLKILSRMPSQIDQAVELPVPPQHVDYAVVHEYIQ